CPAGRGAGWDGAVQIGETVERVGARRSIAEQVRERRKLAARRTLRRAVPDIDTAAAFRVLRAVIAGKRDIEAVRRPPQHLPANAEVVLRVDPVAAGDVVDRAAAVGRR